MYILIVLLFFVTFPNHFSTLNDFTCTNLQSLGVGLIHNHSVVVMKS